MGQLTTFNNLENYIKSGNNENFRYSSFCLIDVNDYNQSRCITNLLDDYYEYLEDYFMEINLSTDEIRKYKYNPKRLAYDVYGDTNLYSFILYINKMSSIKEFDLKTGKVNLIHVDSLVPLLNNIYCTELEQIKSFNIK